MREYFAGILIEDIERHLPLWGKKILDVGGSKGEFCRTLNKLRNCQAINLDPYPEQFGRLLAGDIWPDTKKAFADQIPFDDDEFNLVICRSVLEHIPPDKQQNSLNQMYRVTKPEGICYIAIPPWYNPFAGHAVKPFHYLPFKLAKFLARNINRKKITAKNLAELNLYPITFKKILSMIRQSGFEIIETKDAHLRLHFITRIPILREILVPSVVFILFKKRKGADQ